jgi:hypothetical protein
VIDPTDPFHLPARFAVHVQPESERLVVIPRGELDLPSSERMA